MRFVVVDSERATAAINPTGASREGSGWSGPSNLFSVLFFVFTECRPIPTNEVGGAFNPDCGVWG